MTIRTCFHFLLNKRLILMLMPFTSQRFNLNLMKAYPERVNFRTLGQSWSNLFIEIRTFQNSANMCEVLSDVHVFTKFNLLPEKSIASNLLSFSLALSLSQSVCPFINQLIHWYIQNSRIHPNVKFNHQSQFFMNRIFFSTAQDDYENIWKFFS